MAALDKYLGFTIAEPETEQKTRSITSMVSLLKMGIQGLTIDTQDLTTIFSELDIDAKTLIESAWQRKR